MSVTTERVASLVAPAVEDLGVEVYDVEQAGPVLRILLDRPDGIDLELIAEATRRISRVLDESDPVSGSYTLEVSSPGLERRLRTPEHFQRAVGRTVTVKTRREVDGERRFTGTLASVDGTTVVVAVDEGQSRSFDVADVDRARTVFEWGPTPKKGSKQTAGPAGQAPRTQPRPDQQQSEAS